MKKISKVFIATSACFCLGATISPSISQADNKTTFYENSSSINSTQTSTEALINSSSTSDSISATDDTATQNTQTTDSATSSSEITEENNHVMGEAAKKADDFLPFDPAHRSDLLPEKNTRGLRASSYISAAEANRPTKSFIDVSSHNGNISVAEYQVMKKYGVMGVCVKLTESINYFNPYAKGQIENARKAGLKIAVYHYSWFTNKALAEQEATFFAQKANSLGLSKSTVMINDAEVADLTKGNVTTNSIAFKNKLAQCGYNNVIHYTYFDWFNRKVLNPDQLGLKNCWVAHYPNNPLASNLLHKEFAAWQWASDLVFPGISNYTNRKFDISVAYTSFFDGKSKPKDEYYTTNPKTIVLRNDDYYYQDVDFKVKGKKQAKYVPVTVQGISYSTSGVPRLKTQNGYLTANKKYVIKVTDNISQYYTQVPKYVVTRNDDYFYKDVNFKTKNSKISKYTLTKVDGIVYSDSGVPRFKTAKGYLTTNKSYVILVNGNIANYFTSAPKTVVLKQAGHFYADPNTSTPAKVAPKLTPIAVQGLVYSNAGVPRLKTAQGYLTADKTIVTDVTNYHTSVPKYVVLRNNDFYYQDLDFKVKASQEVKQKLIEVQGIRYSTSGIPRLKTAKGYLTANKNYAIAVTKNINNYYTTAPKYVVTRNNDSFYQDLNFKKKSGSITKFTLTKVDSIVYSDEGVPRFKTAQGYLTTNKSYAIAVVNNINDYVTTAPKVVVLKQTGHFYASPDATSFTKVAPKYTPFTVQELVYSNAGKPRLKTAQGYLTAEKKVITDVTNYYTTAPKYVVLRNDDFYYQDLNFKVKGEQAEKQTLIAVQGIRYTTSGIPRLKTGKGYLTANKNYAIAVTNNIQNYCTTLPNEISLKMDDYYYQDVNFTKKLTKEVHGKRIKVEAIVYSDTGVPRFKTAKGYLTTNKTYIQTY